MHDLRLLGTPHFAGTTPNPGRAARPRPLGLLALLASAGSRGVTRDRAASLLWGEVTDRQARHHLSDALYVLHQELGADAIDASKTLLRLNVVVVRTDLAAFRAALHRADWAAAVAEYRGPFLDGLHVHDAEGFEEWTDRKRAALAQQYASALEALGVAAATAGDWDAAANWWRALLGHDRYNTRAALALARALAADGDRGNAVEMLEEHCRLLHEELGMEAGPEVRALADEVRNGRAAARPPAPPPLVSREPGAVPDARPPADRRDRLLRGLRQGRRGMGAGVGLAALAVAAVWVVSGRSAAPVVDPEVIAVPPFQAITTHPAVQRLAMDAPDLVWAAVTGEFGLRVADPTDVEARWRRVGGASDRHVGRQAALDLARASGAGLLLLGTVAGTDSYVRLGASVLDVRDGRVRVPPVAVEGEYGRFPALVDQLLNEILARDAGVPEHRLPDLARHPAPAVQAYLSGVRAQRPIAWRNDWLLRALELDSTLLLAAVAQYQAGEADQALASLIWRERAQFPVRDAALIVPLIGWRFGRGESFAERIARYGELVRDGSDWSAPLEEWASTLFTFGSGAGMARDDPAVRRALQRVVGRNPDHLVSRFRLAALALFTGDTANARVQSAAYRERAARFAPGEMSWLLTWTLDLRLAHLGGDVRGAARLWRAADRAAQVIAEQPLRWPAVYGSELAPLVGGLLVDGRGLRELDAFMVRLQLASPLPSFPVLSWARARGRQAAMQRIRDALYDQLPPVTAAALRVRDALFLGEPVDARATAAAGFLERVARGAIVPPPDSTDPTPAAVGPARARCWSALWAVAHGDVRGVRETVATLREAPLPYRYAVCAALLEVQLREHDGSDVREAVYRLDEIVGQFPMEAWPFERGVRDLTVGVDNLIVARLLAAHGDTTRALAAIRRGPWRPFAIERAPHWSLGFLPEFLLEEGRLSAATGDTTNAVRALRHYVTLREGGSLVPQEWRDARRMLAALEGKPR